MVGKKVICFWWGVGVFPFGILELSCYISNAYTSSQNTGQPKDKVLVLSKLSQKKALDDCR